MQSNLYWVVLFAPIIAVAQGSAGPVVTTASLRDVAIYQDRSAPAIVASLNEAPISSEIVARIVSIPVRAGDVVEAGVIVAKLDCTTYEITVREANARLDAALARIDLAERRLLRTEQLTLSQTVSEEVFDERETDLAALRAEYQAGIALADRARYDVSRCEVHSPFRALVLRRDAAVGQFTNVGTPMVTLLDLDSIEVQAMVVVGDIESIKGAVQVAFEYDGVRHPVALRNVVGAIDTATRNRQVRLEFSENPALPGAAGRIVWTEQKTYVSADMLVRRGEMLGIFIEEKGIARFVPLPTAQSGRASAVDLPLTARVIVEGHYSLTDGDPVALH